MKVRNGFVSNSSSSSFIVIGTKEPVHPYSDSDPVFIVPDDCGGTTEFGWEIKDHYDFGSKLNWCYLQAEGQPYWIGMIESVLMEELGVTEIKWNFAGGIEGYIDHQSIGGDNRRMFDSRENLIAFLFSPDSYIHTDNDNH